jgi:pyruvate-formate lyase-activating enzyme
MVSADSSPLCIMHCVNSTPVRVAEVYMFDTCTHKCGYCWLAESGQVLDFSQLERFREQSFIDSIQTFFISRTSSESKWLIQLTGGEPLIAPNLDAMLTRIMEAGNQVAFYTALLLGHNHPGFRFLLEHSHPQVAYVMASFHPEAETIETEYFEKIRMLKAAGHKVFLRFVGHPKRLDRLQSLSDRCRELDICFYPTTLLSNRYPGLYTEVEKDMLRGHFSSLSQHIQLEGGLDTTNLVCHAGSRIIAVNLQTGNITPCITVSGPSLGNIFENTLKLNEGPGCCPEPSRDCICDVHFQQSVVISADDNPRFVMQLQGFVPPKDFAGSIAAMREEGVKFYRNPNTGMGAVADDSRLFYTAEEIKENYRKARYLPRTSLRQKNLRELAGAIQELQPASSETRVDRGRPIRIVTPAAPWSYAIAFPLCVPADLSGEIWVRIRAVVLKGAIGFGILNQAGSEFQDRALVAVGEGLTVFLQIAAVNDVSAVIVQNASADGLPSELELEDVAVLVSSGPNDPNGLGPAYRSESTNLLSPQ